MKFIIHADPELAELIPGYLLHRKEDVQKIQGALSAGNYETIGQIGHVMKGSGGGYGFDAITEIGARIEELARNKKADEIRNKLKELEDYLNGVEVVYQ